MKTLIALILLNLSCGRINVSNSEHKVSGEATVRVVVGVDTSICDKLPPEDQQACIIAMIALATEAAKNNTGDVQPANVLTGDAQ